MLKHASVESARCTSQAALDKALCLAVSGDAQHRHSSIENAMLSMGQLASRCHSLKTQKKTSQACIAATRQDGIVEPQTDLSWKANRKRVEEDVFAARCVLIDMLGTRVGTCKERPRADSRERNKTRQTRRKFGSTPLK